MEKFLSVQEVAELIGKNYRQVQHMLVTHKLKGKKVGWAWVINRKDIPEDWITKEA